MNYDEELKAALPRWMEDGKGIRGNAPVDYSASRNDGGDGKLPFESAAIERSVPSQIGGSQGAPFDFPPLDYPWIGQAADSSGNYEVCFGDCDNSSFADSVSSDVNISGFDFEISGGDGGWFAFVFGDSTTSNNGLTLQDTDGNEVKVTWNGSPEIDCTDSDGNTASLLANSFEFDDSDGTAQIVMGYIEADSAWELVFNDGTNSSTLSAGDLSLGGGGTIECTGDGAEIDVGTDTAITNGDISLGDSGTVTIASISYGPTQIQDCNGKTLWILGDTSGWQSP